MDLDTETIDIFREEANEILGELEVVVENLGDVEGDFPKALLEEFANKTDRIMGTASTFYAQYPDYEVFKILSNFGALCKATGYKASTLNHTGLVPIFASFWADTLDIMGDMVKFIDDPEKLAEVNSSSAPVLEKRLIWLAEQIVKITKSQNGAPEAAINVDGLLRKLGIKV